MKNRLVSRSVLLLSIVAVSQACSTAKVRVMPSEDGKHKVISKDIERDGAEEAAHEKAREYCEDQGKKMYVINEDKTVYQGSMDENTRKTVRNASKAAVILGGPAGVMTDSVGIGGAIAGAGTAGAVMTSDRDYEAKFTFTCR